MKCPGCGVLHDEEKKFCDYCGARLKRRPIKGLLAALAFMVILFIGSYLFTTRVLSIHEKSLNETPPRQLTAAAAPAPPVKSSIRHMRSISAAPVMARQAAKMERAFAVAQANDQPAAAEAASPGTATPDSHVADQMESSFKLMRDPLNAEK
jgi:hypothetical protein